MSVLTFPALQPPILLRNSVLMKPMTIMILTDQWISTRSVTLLIVVLAPYRAYPNNRNPVEANWTLAYHIICQIKDNIMYDIKGMNYDIIVMISYHSQYHGLCWPALSVMYIYPNKVLLNHHSYGHLGMLLAWLGRRWTAYRKVQGSSLCTPHIIYGVLHFFLSKSYFL